MPAQSKPVHTQSRQSFPAALLAWYLAQLTTSPLRTKAVTSGVLSGLQELVAQGLSRSRWKGKAKVTTEKGVLGDVIDERVLKMSLYGFLISGPLGHLLFEALDRVFKNAKILQVFASNLIIVPIQNAVYLAAMAVISGAKEPGEITAAVKKSFWPLMRMSWIVSPLSMVFAQKFLPPQLWVPFFNIVGFVFGVIANTKAKKAQQLKHDQEMREKQEREKSDK